MNQKNVKGIIGLVAGLLSILFILLTFVPTEPIEGSSIKFWGSTNTTFGFIAIILAILAIVFGIMSRKGKDKMGPRKAGVIIGIIAVIIAILATGTSYFSSKIADYANGKDVKIIKNMDDNTRADIDKLIEELKKH